MKKSLLLLIVILLTSCKSQLEKPFVRNTVEVDLIEIRKEITPSEYKSLVWYTKEHYILGETYQELVDKANKYWELENNFEDRQRKTNQEAIEDME